MVASITRRVATVLVAGSALLMQKYAVPRLPVYKLQLLPLQTMPVFDFTENFGLTNFKSKLVTNVEFFNENYMNIDVHALTFDLFGPNWRGELKHIGQIQDRNQHIGQIQEKKLRKLQQRTGKKQQNVKISSDPMWQIAPRADFSTTDELYVTPYLRAMLTIMARLLYGLWQGSGSLVMPTTGVIHIKARLGNAPGTPFTVSIVCDNVVDAWTLLITGAECTMQQLTPGWKKMERALNQIQRHAVNNLKANATGNVLY